MATTFGGRWLESDRTSVNAFSKADDESSACMPCLVDSMQHCFIVLVLSCRDFLSVCVDPAGSPTLEMLISQEHGREMVSRHLNDEQGDLQTCVVVMCYIESAK